MLLLLCKLEDDFVRPAHCHDRVSEANGEVEMASMFRTQVTCPDFELQ